MVELLDMWPDGIRDWWVREPLALGLWREGKPGCQQNIFNGWLRGHSLGRRSVAYPHASQTLIFSDS